MSFPSARNRRRGGALVLAVLIVAAGCANSRPKAVGVDSPAGHSTTTAPPSTGSRPASATTTTGPSASSTVPPGGEISHVPQSDDDLEALLITDPPAGFEQQDDDVGDTGPSDLAKAVRDDGSPGARSTLTSEGFVRGYQRLWETQDGAQIVVFLYQFATVAGTRQALIRTSSLDDDPTADLSTFSPSGLPAGAFGLSGTQGGQTAAVVAYCSGVFLVQINANGTDGESAEQQLANAIAVDQLHRL